MAEWYLWIKALHVMSVIAWMAATLYLPRLFVYHSGVAAGSEASELFKVMERRLLKGIMNPAIVASWVFGLMLVHVVGGWEWWLIIKGGCVVAMSAIHGECVRFVKAFARDERPRSARWFRVFNEVPAALIIVIVVMVIVKPFV